jgi:predicted RNase H-like HicB family nuclease
MWNPLKKAYIDESLRVLEKNKGVAMTAREYLKLPYTIVIRHITDESGDYYFATVSELDGCMGDGATYEAAFADIEDAMEGWIQTRLANGFPVPSPFEAEKADTSLRLPSLAV